MVFGKVENVAKETGTHFLLENGMTVAKELAEVVAVEETVVEVVEAVEINVYFELGYKWSVDITGKDESVATGLNKAEAMKLARQLKKEAGKGAIINEQKLTKEEKAENISNLHNDGFTFRNF